jgi:CubicO group peptidase (beta-lactamase class C family)
VHPRFAPVRAVFADVVAGQRGTGAALAVWHRGAWVVDLWGGYADAGRTVSWGRDSIVMPYSVTKPFTAVCGLLLVERGRVGLDEPLSTYWPELRVETTLRQVLAHRSGLVLLDEPADESVLYDWAELCRRVTEQSPTWPSGTAQGESALLFGHLVGELVRRVDGRSLGAFLAAEVCRPLGLDFHVGLGPAELERAVELTGFDAEFRRRAAEAPGLMGRALANPPGVLDPSVVNSDRWRTSELPAVNGHGTARAVAGLYVALEEGRLLSAELRREMTTPGPREPDLVVGDERSWGLGVVVEPDGYGMGGVGGSFGWWSHDGGYALAFLTGEIAGHDRGDRLEQVVREVLGLPPL